MKKLQLDEVAFQKSEGCFPGIFNLTFGLIRLIEPILIKVCWNQQQQGYSPSFMGSLEALNFRPTFVGNLCQA